MVRQFRGSEPGHLGGALPDDPMQFSQYGSAREQRGMLDRLGDLDDVAVQRIGVPGRPIWNRPVPIRCLEDVQRNRVGHLVVRWRRL